ncbi:MULTISPECIES: hypothetical protein [Desulfobacula]|uniref:Conserved uncharacterized protein n=2 Tax=Desulfobacula TaxID=28222 RepID=K0NJX2_DESTT|nr:MULTISPECIES: hypothetical protein [Desulfobacula]CCK79157.1 conserved uncharacterized protein [Desulfobacula toluolica Tol2]SDU05694.1 hypothetical protein SAMN04487931_104110 [Desulfobacula phenolica]
MNFKNKDKDGLFKSIFTAYFILLLHVFLLAGVGVSIILFKGVYHYLPWIMAGIGILVLSIAWIFYRRMKNSTTDIKDILSMPEFQDRTVEVKLMGGLASFKITPKDNHALRIGHHMPAHPNRLLIEDAVNRTEQKILELTALFEKDLITREEFEKAKQNLIQG